MIDVGHVYVMRLADYAYAMHSIVYAQLGLPFPFSWWVNTYKLHLRTYTPTPLAQIYLHTFVYKYIHIYIHTYIHIYIYTYIDT